jgi:serine/threonine protein kinase
MAYLYDVHALEAKILKVEDDIERVNVKIDEADAELRRIDPSDLPGLKYWRTKEEQLRTEKEQLRTKEAQLLQRLDAPPVPLIPVFLSLLKSGGIERPDNKVIAKICASFAKELHVNTHDVDAAVSFYRRIKDLPSTLTRSIVQGQAGVNIAGPLSDDKPKLLAGVRQDGSAIVIKMLFTDTDDVRPLWEREAEIDCEVKCCKDLAVMDGSIALVQHEVVVLQVPNEFSMQTRRRGTFQALLMPRYLNSLARSQVFPKAVVAREARRLIAALKYMHAQGYVHMDVKGDNVFVDNSGAWFLGDFGSACRIGEVIRTTTPTFYHCSMGANAIPKYDWFMLLVLLLVELEDKDEWYQRLVVEGQRCVDYDRVMREADRAACDEAIPQDLRDAICEVKDTYLSA